MIAKDKFHVRRSLAGRTGRFSTNYQAKFNEKSTFPEVFARIMRHAPIHQSRTLHRLEVERRLPRENDRISPALFQWLF